MVPKVAWGVECGFCDPDEALHFRHQLVASSSKVSRGGHTMHQPRIRRAPQFLMAEKICSLVYGILHLLNVPVVDVFHLQIVVHFFLQILFACSLCCHDIQQLILSFKLPLHGSFECFQFPPEVILLWIASTGLFRSPVKKILVNYLQKLTG